MRLLGDRYDWRRLEARLNALPQYTTELDGTDIHVIHLRSPHPDALPLVLTHGWPGSVVEFLDVLDPLVDPVGHGGDAADAFDVVCPSLPGFGFSGKPTGPGWGPPRIAAAWAELMSRLGLRAVRRAGRRLGIPRHDRPRRASSRTAWSASTSTTRRSGRHRPQRTVRRPT